MLTGKADAHGLFPFVCVCCASRIRSRKVKSETKEGSQRRLSVDEGALLPMKWTRKPVGRSAEEPGSERAQTVTQQEPRPLVLFLPDGLMHLPV